MGWASIVGSLALKGLQKVIFWQEFRNWQAERLDRKVAATIAEAREREKLAPPPTLPPGAANLLVVFVACWLATGASCQPPRPADVTDLRIYCCDATEGHPERCTATMRAALCPGYATPVPRPTIAPTPGPWCDADRRCNCYGCVDTPADRRAVGAPSTECLQRYWVACPAATPTQAPTASPVPTVTPTPVPTSMPTLQPSPTPTPVPQDGCLDLSTVPALAVPAVQAGPCERGYTRIDLDGLHLCMRYWHCADGNDRFNCPTRVYDNVVTFHNILPMTSDGMLHDPGRPRTDALCRNLDENGNVIYPGPEPDGYVPAPWERAGICRPLICAATPAPTQPPVGTPPPRPTVQQPADFRLNFVNACSALHYTKRMPDGSLRGECDGTYRFIGTLASGERWGNACDGDHMRCAVESCPNATTDELAAHRKTWELCGGRDWDSPLGVELHVDGARFEQKAENPFQHYVYGDGSPVEIYGCLPHGARTHDGLPIPVSGEGCGGRKTVTWDEPR